MDIIDIKELDFVKQLENEGFEVFLHKDAIGQVIHYNIKRGKYTPPADCYQYTFYGIERMKSGLEKQKQAILETLRQEVISKAQHELPDVDEWENNEIAIPIPKSIELTIQNEVKPKPTQSSYYEVHFVKVVDKEGNIVWNFKSLRD